MMNDFSPRAGAANGLVLAIVAALAVGVGVTGTSLWTQSRNATPTATAAPAAPVAPSIAGQSPAQAALTLGNDQYDRQQWPQAIESYRAAIAGGLDDPNVRTDLGNALRFAGQPRAALEQYQIAQKQSPAHEQSLFNQGGLWAFSLHDNAKAVAAWKLYLQRFPNGQSAADARRFIQQHAK